MQKITPFLWFATEAEEAANFYVSLFKDAQIEQITRYPEGTPGPAGSVMTVSFTLNGQRFTALNGGPVFKFTEAISFVVECEDQAEVDHFWEKLTADGGQEVECGWLKDKFGLSWQIVPKRFWELMKTDDPKQAERVTKAMLQMKKFDVAALEAAAAAA